MKENGEGERGFLSSRLPVVKVKYRGSCDGILSATRQAIERAVKMLLLCAVRK